MRACHTWKGEIQKRIGATQTSASVRKEVGVQLIEVEGTGASSSDHQWPTENYRGRSVRQRTPARERESRYAAAAVFE